MPTEQCELLWSHRTEWMVRGKYGEFRAETYDATYGIYDGENYALEDVYTMSGAGIRVQSDWPEGAVVAFDRAYAEKFGHNLPRNKDGEIQMRVIK